MKKPSMRDAFAFTTKGGDHNALALVENREEASDNERIVRNAFATMAIEEASLILFVERRESIIQSYQRTVQEAVKIGLHLLDLRSRVPAHAFNHFVSTTDILPFGSTYAFKLMRVAESTDRFRNVIGKAFAVERLPSVGVCYELTVLDDNTLREAKERGLLEQNTTMKRVGDFKKALREKAVLKISNGRSETLRLLMNARRDLAKARVLVLTHEETVRHLEALLAKEDASPQ